MITDSLTIVTIAIVILTVIFVFAAMVYSHKTMKKEMKMLGQRTIAMGGDDEIGKLCKEIMDINPDACPLLGDNLNKIVSNNPEQLKTILKKELQQLKRS